MTLSGMRQQDIPIFKSAAKLYNVFILLRATNPNSLRYVGKPGYSAKRLDCKAKTADFAVHGETRRYDVEGLVVDPTVLGRAAFSASKYPKALKEWEKFAPRIARGIHDAGGRPALTYFPGGRLYGVQMDPEHPRFGCVMFAPSSLMSAATYIYGHYDLYAIVPADRPSETIFVVEKMLDEAHVRSKELLDVQTFINKRLGSAMILHGDQEKYADHSDEEVYAFHPDGLTVTRLTDIGAIRAFYQTTLQGRRTGGKTVQTESAGGVVDARKVTTALRARWPHGSKS